MDPLRACSMLENLAGGLSQLDPDHAALYATNARLAREQLTQAYDLMKTSLNPSPVGNLSPSTTDFPISPTPST